MERGRREEREKKERGGGKRKRERGKGKDCGLGDVRHHRVEEELVRRSPAQGMFQAPLL